MCATRDELRLSRSVCVLVLNTLINSVLVFKVKPWCFWSSLTDCDRIVFHSEALKMMKYSSWLSFFVLWFVLFLLVLFSVHSLLIFCFHFSKFIYLFSFQLFLFFTLSYTLVILFILHFVHAFIRSLALFLLFLFVLSFLCVFLRLFFCLLNYSLIHSYLFVVPFVLFFFC